LIRGEPRLSIGQSIAAGKLLVEFYNFRAARDFSDRDLIVFRIDRRGIIADSFLVFFSNSGRNSEEINDHKQGDERLQGELPEIFVRVRVDREEVRP